MDSLETVKDFFTTASSDISISAVLADLLIAALLATCLRWLYVRYGTSLSNRKMFAANFALLACTTTLIIIVVKSSLALSLGLVGALSIVRFRSAIKEPEELAYLFLTIAIGLGLGADQRAITLCAFVFIASLIVVSGWRRGAEKEQNLYLTISSVGDQRLELAQIVEALTANCAALELRRFEQQADTLEAAFMVEFDSFQQLEDSQKELGKLSRSMNVSYSDCRGIL